MIHLVWTAHHGKIHDNANKASSSFAQNILHPAYYVSLGIPSDRCAYLSTADSDPLHQLTRITLAASRNEPLLRISDLSLAITNSLTYHKLSLSTVQLRSWFWRISESAAGALRLLVEVDGNVKKISNKLLYYVIEELTNVPPAMKFNKRLGTKSSVKLWNFTLELQLVN